MMPLANRLAAALLALLLVCAPAAHTFAAPGAGVTTAPAFTAPVASSFSATVPANRQSIVQLQGSDAEGTALTFAVVAGPSHGALTSLNAATGAVVYTPAADYVGADSFTFNVTSGGDTSATVTAMLSVTNAKTTVTDFFVDAFGAPRKGKVTFILTQPVTSPSGIVPVGSSVSASLGTGGSFTVQLYPSRSLNPAAFYQVWWTDSSTLKQELVGVYDIPLSTTAVGLSPYKVTDTNLAARYTFASVAGLEALINAVANASLAQLMTVSRTTGKLQYWDGANLADSVISQSGGAVTVGGNATVSGNLTVTGTLNAPGLSDVVTKVGAGGGAPPGVGLCLVSTGPGSSSWSACPGGGSGGSGASVQQQKYFEYLNNLLEPDAYEAIKRGNYTYTVGPNEHKIAMSVWRSVMDTPDTGWFEVRYPRYALSLRDVTLRGTWNPGPVGAGSHALIIDPSKAAYSDPVGTYYDRQFKLNTQLRTSNVGITYSGTNATFVGDTHVLCGTYGCVVEQVTNYDSPYFVIVTSYGQWINMANELGDVPQTQLTSAPYTVSGNGVWRFGDRPNMPLTRYMISAARIGPGDPEFAPVVAGGSITYKNLDSTWSKVTDSRTWLFRDDSWGVGTNNADVDTTKWTVQDSTVGAASGVSINQKFKWHEITGAGSNYGVDGIRSVQTFTRTAGQTFDVNVSMVDNSRCAVGWTKTTGSDINDWAHAFVLDTMPGQYQGTVYEDGSPRVATGSGTMLSKRILHLRITLNADGSAAYTLQSQGFQDGSGNYADPGSSFWHTLPVPGSSSATNSLKLTATCFNGTGYFNDLKVSAAPQ